MTAYDEITSESMYKIYIFVTLVSSSRIGRHRAAGEIRNDFSGRQRPARG